MPPRTRPQIVRWAPNPGPQELVLRCPAEVVLYGGAAGGGKTDVLLIAAALGIGYDGYSAIIFRRTYKELEKHIVERSRQLFGTIGRYSEKDHKWTFTTATGGRSYIYLGFLEHDKDVFNYHGGEFQFIGFDESCMFSVFQVRFMLTRLRSSKTIPYRKMMLATNPLGPGFGWHKQLFIENFKQGRLQPGKIYNNSRWPDNDEPTLKTTCFVPAMVWDNPILLKNDPGYVTNIRSQGGALTRALLYGSWDETVFTALQFDRTIHTCDPFPIPADAPRWIGLDWGKGDKACAVWQTSVGGRIYAYRDHTRPGDLIVPFAQEVAARTVGEKIDFCVLSHECFAEHGREPGNTQADQFIKVLSRHDIPVVKSGRDPAGRLMLLREFLRWTKDPISNLDRGLKDTEYWQARVHQEGDRAWREYARLQTYAADGDLLPKLQLFRPKGNDGCPYLISSLPLLTTEIDEPDKIAEGQDDHGFDGLTYGLKYHIYRDTEDVIKAYMEQIGKTPENGVMPDSGFAAEFAMKEVMERDFGEQSEGPFQMQSERFNAGDGRDDMI